MSTKDKAPFLTSRVIAVAVAGGLTIGSCVAVATVSQAAEPSQEQVEHYSPEIDLALFTTPSVGPRLSSGYTTDTNISDEINVKTMRYLGSDDGFNFYTALAKDDRICVFVEITGAKGSVGWTCTDPQTFAAHGLGIQSASTESTTRAYLIPDNAPTSGLRKSANANLVFGDPTQKGQRSILDSSTTSSSFSVYPMPAIEVVSD